MNDELYEQKYLKYKTKYLSLRDQTGGNIDTIHGVPSHQRNIPRTQQDKFEECKRTKCSNSSLTSTPRSREERKERDNCLNECKNEYGKSGFCTIL
jgi:hypothetical protein